IAREEAEHLARLARMVVSELELRRFRQHLPAERAARGLAEARFKLLGDLTDAAVAAADFKSAMRTCLHLIAEHVAADCALAFGMAPNATYCEIEAEYVASGAGAGSYLDFMRHYPLRDDNSIAGASVLQQRLIAVADLATLDVERYPITTAALKNGFQPALRPIRKCRRQVRPLLRLPPVIARHESGSRDHPQPVRQGTRPAGAQARRGADRAAAVGGAERERRGGDR